MVIDPETERVEFVVCGVPKNRHGSFVGTLCPYLGVVTEAVCPLVAPCGVPRQDVGI